VTSRPALSIYLEAVATSIVTATIGDNAGSRRHISERQILEN
jgi:hypothetical protein